MTSVAVQSPVAGPASIAPGCGRVSVVRNGPRSVVSRALATSPFRLLTPGNHGHAAWIYSSTYGGGLVGGDAVVLGVDVGAGAAALLATQASTKVYRSPRGATTHVHARVAEDGLLVMAPDPVVCFARSRYTQSQDVDLADGAGLVLIDWMTSGRRASGEHWAFDGYETRLTVRIDGRLALYDAMALRQSDGDLRARLGRFEVFALVVVAGARFLPEAATIVSEAAAMPLEQGATLLVSAAMLRAPGETGGTARAGTAPPGAGCVLRVAATSVEGASRTIRGFLRFLPAVLGDDPWARKW